MKAWHLILFVAGIFFACKSGSSSAENNDSNDVSVASNKMEEMAKTDSAVVTAGGANTGSIFQSGNQSPAPNATRQIIRTAHLQMESRDFKAFAASVNTIVKSQNAWIETEQETQSDYQRQNVLQIKVPAEKFEDLMHGLSGLDGRLVEKQIESEDVTNAIVDIKGRLEAKKQIRARYMELLSQAKSMEDILQVQGEINSITEEMESAAYNLQNMQSQAATSTIYLTYFQTLEGSGFSEPGLLSRLWEAIQNGGEGVTNVLIGLVALWPLWIILAGTIYWIKRRRFQTKMAVASKTVV